jgi:hypothetical protein
MGNSANSTSKDSVRTEPYLQRTTQSLVAKNDVGEWTFCTCICDPNEPHKVASKTAGYPPWKVVSRVSSNSMSLDSSSPQSDARNSHTGTTWTETPRPSRLIQSPSTRGYTKVTAVDRGEPAANRKTTPPAGTEIVLTCPSFGEFGSLCNSSGPEATSVRVPYGLSASPVQSQPEMPLHRIDQPLFKRIPLQSNLPPIPKESHSAAYTHYDPEAAKKHEEKLTASLEAQQLALEEHIQKLMVSHPYALTCPHFHNFSVLLLSPFQH